MSDIAPIDAEWNELPSKRDLQARLDRLSLSADAKVLMGQLLETTADVAGLIIDLPPNRLCRLVCYATAMPGAKVNKQTSIFSMPSIRRLPGGQKPSETIPSMLAIV